MCKIEKNRICNDLSRLGMTETDARHFEKLLEAILNVGEEYISYDESDPYLLEDFETIHNDHLERVFAYELYHQWSGLKDKKFILNAETQKLVAKSIRYEKGSSHSVNVYPDLVLHGGQGDINREKQLIVCEIKRENAKPKSVFADLLKLNCFVEETKDFGFTPRFKYGAFIVVGDHATTKFKSLIDIKDDTRLFLGEKEISFANYKNEGGDFANNFSKIICIAYDGETLEFDTLENCLKNN